MKQNYVLRSTVLVLASSWYVSVAQVNVLTYHNNNSRTGENLQETILSPSNVKSRSFGKLFTYQVDGYVYAQPLYVSGLNIPGKGIFNVVFVATQHNSVYAFDADRNTNTATGLLWQINLGPSAPTPSTDFGNHFGAFDDIVPEVGITSTPVIDLVSGTIYVDAFTYEGQSYFHRVHALDISTGAERPFSPVVVSASVSARGIGSTNGVLRFQAKQQIQRAALTLAGGILYVAFASYADTDPYHGWIIGYNPKNLQQLPSYVFNSTPSSTEAAFGDNAGGGGIWMSGCGLSVDANNNLYFATGDGAFNANVRNGTEIANSFVKLSTAGKLAVADYFTPWNQEFLASNNLDLGSGGVMLLPDQPGPFPRLMVGAGKSGLVYLMNRDMMTTGNRHFNTNGPGDFVLQTVSLQGGSFDTPAYFNGTIYYAGTRDVLTALSLSNGVLPNLPSSLGPRTFGFPGATPSISANGNVNGIVWVIQRANPAVLAAYNATNLSKEIYNSSQAGTRDRLVEGVKFIVPTVANGKVYVGGQYALSVFGLLPQKASSSFAAATYSGLFYEQETIRQDTSGELNARTTKNGSYSGTLQIAGRRYSFSGQLDPLGTATKTINRKGQSQLTLNLQVDNIESGFIVGTVSDGTWTADLTAYRGVFNARTNPAAVAGKYTLILPGGTDGNPQIPQGAGFGSISINVSGQVKFSGALADGTKTTETGYLSENGQWPVYLSLYQGRGQLLGWVNFTAVPSKDLEGNLSWIKSGNAQDSFYPNGFEMNLAVRGSSYEEPGKNLAVLQFSDGQVDLSGGGLTGSLVNDITLNPNNKITNLGSNPLTLTITTSSGLFKGSVLDPEDRKTISFRGVVLQDENAGFGYFLKSEQSGRMHMAPR